MISKIIFRKIKFNNISYEKFNKHIIKKGLFVFPAGPALASIDKSQKYHESLRKADLVFFDSGFLVLLLKVFKNTDVKGTVLIAPEGININISVVTNKYKYILESLKFFFDYRSNLYC